MDGGRGGRAVGSGRTLSAEQELEVRRLIRDRTPDLLKTVHALRPRRAAADLIRDRYGIKLAARTTGLSLGRWGFTPQEPMNKAHEPSPAAVKKWLDEQSPVIAACAKIKGAEIHRRHETGLRSDGVRERSCAPKGQTAVIRVINKRHGRSAVSTAIDKGQMRWKRLRQQARLRPLDRLPAPPGEGREGRAQGDHLVLGKLRVHRSISVRAWLPDHKEQIEILYLPSDSPELKPNEMANADPSGSWATSSTRWFATRLEFDTSMPGQSAAGTRKSFETRWPRSPTRSRNWFR